MCPPEIANMLSMHVTKTVKVVRSAGAEITSSIPQK
jgi:hypothetical protein